MVNSEAMYFSPCNEYVTDFAKKDLKNYGMVKPKYMEILEQDGIKGIILMLFWDKFLKFSEFPWCLDFPLITHL